MNELVVKKPWGSYVDYFRDIDGQVVFKVIIIDPGCKISYQIHEKRGEFWYIGKGKGSLKTSGFGAESAEDNYIMSQITAGEFILIEKGAAHQISNNEEDVLIIYEMQFGECSEDDIIRIDDPYNR